MSQQDLSMTFSVDQTPEQAFAAIMNVRGWWSEGIEGSAEKIGDEFTYRYKEMHDSKQRLVEAVPGKKIVWLVVDSRLSFTKDKGEWNGTQLCFELSKKREKGGDKTEVRFTHLGLVPAFECFEACTKGWTFYVNDSLRGLMTTGKGQPHQG